MYCGNSKIEKKVTLILAAAGVGKLNYLKKCPYVKEYRIGGHGEGGLGCTVVTLK